ncbi:MAG: apolipoprotein N-acyltransferase [Gammaproteobacteria bacterium]
MRILPDQLQSPENISWDALSFLAGLFCTLAFSPFNLAYGVVPALGCLFFVSHQLLPKRAALRGYLFGLGQFGLGVSWVYVSVHDYGGGGIIGSLCLTSLFVGFWALFPAMAVYLSVKLPVNKAYRLGIFPLLWLLVEYLRGQIVLEGFPWLQLAYSQLDTPLAGYVPLFGVYGAGLLTALSAVIVIRVGVNPKASLWLAALLFGIWGAGSYLKTVSWTQAIGEPIKVTLIQGNISQDRKWLPETRISTILQYIRMTEAHWDSDLIIWPESSVPAYLSDVQETFITPLNKAAKEHQTDLIVSVPSYGAARGEKYNSAISLGGHEGMYRKIHLLPFGEYMPLQPVSGWILAHFDLRLSSFTAGTPDQPLLRAAGYPFNISICYEDAFAENAMRGLPDAAYLSNVTNDGWFGDSIEPHQHLQIARMRALETGRYLLRSTNTGVTAIISPAGQVITQAPLFTLTALTGMIEPMSGVTPYARMGDAPILYATIALLIIVMLLGNADVIRRSFVKLISKWPS